jgi:hypothetical protein
VALFHKPLPCRLIQVLDLKPLALGPLTLLGYPVFLVLLRLRQYPVHQVPRLFLGPEHPVLQAQRGLQEVLLKPH